MKIGQTFAIFYLTRIIASFIGFGATVVFARILGAEALGIYNLVLGVIAWIVIAGELGISGALSKRVSEGKDQEEYIVAALISIGAIFFIVSLLVLGLREHLNNYFEYHATIYLIIISFSTLIYSYLSSILTGLRLVHIKGIFSTLKNLLQVGLQVPLILVGFGLSGLFWGYFIGQTVIILIITYFVLKNISALSVPNKYHYKHLYDFAKYSWLGKLKSRTFRWVDIIVLGVFVTNSFVGIYSIAWNYAAFLIIFSSAIGTTIFPEISKDSAENNEKAVRNVIEDSLAYAGLIMIPGLIGSILINDLMMIIFGSEFLKGQYILVILIFAVMVGSYQKQMLTALNGIDCPKLAFKINTVFILVNIIFNITFIYIYGWYGAAFATLFSMIIATVHAYFALRSKVLFKIPLRIILKQLVSAVVMAIPIHVLRTYSSIFSNLHVEVQLAICLILGSIVYFLILYIISKRFRNTISDNIPSL